MTKDFLKRILPNPLFSLLRFVYSYILSLSVNCKLKYLIQVQPKRYVRYINEIKQKDKIKVAFFAIHSSVWKYDSLYRLMINHPRFDPIIVVCPVVNYGFENMLIEMQRCYSLFKENGYNVVRTYDVDSQTYLDVKNVINPDIIFYTNPYKGLIDDRYYVTNYLDRLTCYAPYSASICSISSQFDKPLHYLVWKFFLENQESYRIACKEMKNGAKNAVVIGYPFMDPILSNTFNVDKIWKHHQKIKLIWAPHHSFDVECGIHFSNFFQVAESMLTIASKYRNSIQIAFKPHPLLYVKLVNVWGKERTDRYYREWADGVNTQYEDGEYIGLFMSSDAMIFDSVSFIYEYLFTKKRSLFIYGDGIEEQLNDFGKKALSCHQIGKTTRDIENFVLDLIEGKADPMINVKQKYYKDSILPSNGNTASQSIISEILNSLN